MEDVVDRSGLMLVMEKSHAKNLLDAFPEAEDKVFLIRRFARFWDGLLGGCPRTAIFSKIKACEKNYRRYIVDIPRIIF